MYIPGFGDVSTPEAYQRTLAADSARRAAAEAARAFIVPITERFGVAGPSGALFRDRPQQVARDPRPSDLPQVNLRDLGSTGPGADDDVDGGDTVISSTPTPYPAVLPPLSPEMLKIIEDRRRAANRALAEAEVRTESQRTAAELAAAGRLLGIEEETGRQRRAGMQELAARGVARSPMFANPFRRELARVQQQQIGESQQQLASTLDELGVALEAARQRREQQLAQIAFDEMVARSNVSRLMGA